MITFKFILLISIIAIILYAIIDRICTVLEVKKFTEHLDEIIQIGSVDKVDDGDADE